MKGGCIALCQQMYVESWICIFLIWLMVHSPLKTCYRRRNDERIFMCWVNETEVLDLTSSDENRKLILCLALWLKLFNPRVSETLIYLFWSLFSAKMARLKQAKEEAEKEIAEFRAQMDAQFQRKVSEVKLMKKRRTVQLIPSCNSISIVLKVGLPRRCLCGPLMALF